MEQHSEKVAFRVVRVDGINSTKSAASINIGVVFDWLSLLPTVELLSIPSEVSWYFVVEKRLGKLVLTAQLEELCECRFRRTGDFVRYVGRSKVDTLAVL